MSVMRVSLTIASLLFLAACTHHDPFGGFTCEQAADPDYCRMSVLGLYQSGQNNMYNRWTPALHQEPIQSGYQPVVVPRLQPSNGQNCQFIGNQVFCP